MATKISSIIYSSHLASEEADGWHKAQDWATLQAAVERALRAEYPDAEVSVEVRHHVSGVGSGTTVSDDLEGGDHYRLLDLAASVADKAVEAWMMAGADLPEIAAAHLAGIEPAWCPEQGTSDKALGLGDEAWGNCPAGHDQAEWGARCKAAVRQVARERVAEEEAPEADYHCTKIDTERDHEGRVHLVAYGHSTRGCDAAGCAGDELRLGRIDPEQCSTPDGESEYAEIDGDAVSLPAGTIARARELADA